MARFKCFPSCGRRLAIDVANAFPESRLPPLSYLPPPQLPDDPILVFVLLLESITPTNADVLVLTRLHNVAVDDTTLVVFWCYLASIFTMPCWLVLHVWLVTTWYPTT